MKNIEKLDFLKMINLISPNDLKKSFNNFDSEANKKNIFAGEYIFKGILAEQILNNKIKLKSILHIEKALKNIYSQKELKKIFDLYNLQNYIQKNQEINDKYVKTCVLAFFGILVLNASPENIDLFIYKTFIRDSDFLYKSKDNINFEKLAKDKYLYHFKEHIMDNTTKNKDEYITTIFTSQKEILRSVSKSYKYSRKKAYKSLYNILKNAGMV